MKKSKRVLAWGGFAGNTLGWAQDFEPQYKDGGCHVYTVFKTKKAAMLRYRDVRRIEIREVGRDRGRIHKEAKCLSALKAKEASNG